MSLDETTGPGRQLNEIHIVGLGDEWHWARGSQVAFDDFYFVVLKSKNSVSLVFLEVSRSHLKEDWLKVAAT